MSQSNNDHSSSIDDELRDDVCLSLESVREQEKSLSEDNKLERERVYQEYANRIKMLNPEERLNEQNKFTKINLTNAGISIADLKILLHKAGLYQGEIDEIFSAQLAQSISTFQEKYEVIPIDGVAGSKTLSRLSEIICLS